MNGIQQGYRRGSLQHRQNCVAKTASHLGGDIYWTEEATESGLFENDSKYENAKVTS